MLPEVGPLSLSLFAWILLFSIRTKLGCTDRRRLGQCQTSLTVTARLSADLALRQGVFLRAGLHEGSHDNETQFFLLVAPLAECFDTDEHG